jgi:saccharopine dehydrogenase-like NADP-dependent oxidoreductase
MERDAILILGAGTIGRAAAVLAAHHRVAAEIHLGDLDPETARAAAADARRAAAPGCRVEPFQAGSLDAPVPAGVLVRAAVLLDCLPAAEAVRTARLALDHGLHYANVTEGVEETAAIAELAAAADTAFVLQTGVAPGYVDVAAMALVTEACRAWRVDGVEVVEMRVGALPVHAAPPSFYAWTWNPRGVANQYLRPGVGLRDGAVATLPSLGGRRQRVIGGRLLEEAQTAGGAADLPQALAGRARRLDYMTLRWPGHYAYVEDILEGALPDERLARLEGAMERDVPHVEEDLVIVYAAVQGRDHRGTLRRLEASREVRPLVVGGVRLKAIQATTAGALVEVARLVLAGGWRGLVQQSALPASDFLGGPIVSAVYGHGHPELAVVGGDGDGRGKSPV